MTRTSAVSSPLFYAASKFSSALALMATSDRPLRDRILMAHREFHPAGIDMTGIPEHIVSAFRALMARLTWAEPKRGEGTYVATLAAVSDAEVSQLARLIADIACDLESELQRALLAEERARALGGPVPRWNPAQMGGATR